MCAAFFDHFSKLVAFIQIPEMNHHGGSLNHESPFTLRHADDCGKLAEADGNRTRRGRVATPPIGFEVRGPHQQGKRFHEVILTNIGPRAGSDAFSVGTALSSHRDEIGKGFATLRAVSRRVRDVAAHAFGLFCETDARYTRFAYSLPARRCEESSQGALKLSAWAVSFRTVNAFSLGDAARILGVSRSRLRYWGQVSLVEPTADLGSRPAYGFTDLVSVRSVLGLLESGVSLSRIRRSVDGVRESMPNVALPLRELRVWAEGYDRVVVRHEGVLIQPDGQTVIDFSEEAALPAGEQVLARIAFGDQHQPTLEASEAYDGASAREWFERGCKLDSERATYADAIEAYLHAIELDPGYADAHCNLGSLYFNRDRRATARACFERALEIDSNHVEANLNLAIVLEESGQNESALQRYKRALASDPLYADTHVSLALLYEKLGLRRKARTHWLRYVGLEPNGAWGDVARGRLND